MTDTVDHFPSTEFACHAYTAPDGYHQAEPYPREWADERLIPLKRMLEKIRLKCGSHPVTILCGYRTVAYNAELRRRGLQGERHATGVALHSQHTEGRAADITIYSVPLVELLHNILVLYGAGELDELGGLGYYPANGFIHVDTFKHPSGQLRRWNG